MRIVARLVVGLGLLYYLGIFVVVVGLSRDHMLTREFVFSGMAIVLLGVMSVGLRRAASLRTQRFALVAGALWFLSGSVTLFGTTGEGDCHRQHPVVRADEDSPPAGDGDRDRTATRADSRVDDGEHDTLRDVRDAAGEGERAGPHVERRNLVGEIEHRYVRGDVGDDTLNDTDELVTDSVVGKKRHVPIPRCRRR